MFKAHSKAEKIDLTDRRFRADHIRSFGELREQGPLLLRRMSFLGTVYLATDYETVNEVLKDSARFVRNPANAGKKGFMPLQWMIPRSVKPLMKNMLGVDEPDHRRLRSLVDQAFARQSIEGMSGRITAICDDALDHCEEICRHDGNVDLIEHFARPVPLTVICELLGLPDADRPKFKKWFSAVSTATSFMSLFRIIPGAKKTIRYLREEFEFVRRQPREGLITALVQAEQNGDRLSEDELLSMVFLLLVAGHETTVHLISNAVLTLLENPEAKERLVNDWSLSNVMVEEVLRYTSPAQFGKGRFVVNDMEFQGTQLKRGDTVVPILASANLDPTQFENADQFVIDREPNYHLGFGTGPHVCLGLKLARAETVIAVRRLFDRFPNLKPAFDLSQADWSRRIGLRSLTTLRLSL